MSTKLDKEQKTITRSVSFDAKVLAALKKRALKERRSVSFIINELVRADKNSNT